MAGGTWEEKMAERAAGRAAAEIARRRQPLEPDRPGHAGHHLHRTPRGTECSCGGDVQEVCVVDDDEDRAWWQSQRCTACGRPAVVLEGAAGPPAG